MTRPTIQSVFARSPLLCDISPEMFHAQWKSYTADAVLEDRFMDVPCVGVVASGRVEVWSIAPDGNGVLLSALHPGECFGIANLFQIEDLQTLLRCSETSEVLYIPKTEVEAVMRENSAFAIRYASLCNTKIQFLLKRIALLTVQTSRGKLLSYLLFHVDADGIVSLTMSRETIASSLSMSRSALYRELKYLEERHILRLEKDRWVVTDRQALQCMLYAME